MTEFSRFNTDAVAASYAAGRPTYPAALYDTLAGRLGGSLAGIHVVDLGAGTGIASRQLADRGAVVTAVELSAPMIAELAATSPRVRPVRGSATALPLRRHCADLVTCAQAWHWMDPAPAIAEFLRILRPGGVFAAWWNTTHRDSGWEREQERRIEAADRQWRRTGGGPYGERDNEFGTYPGLSLATHEFAWQRTIPLDRHLENLASKSYIAALPERDEFLRAEHAILAEQFPDERVTERFSTHMVIVSPPSTAPSGE